jgi:hypothetical protein
VPAPAPAPSLSQSAPSNHDYVIHSEYKSPEPPAEDSEMSDLAKAIAEAVTPDDMNGDDDDETKSNYLNKHKEINFEKIEKILD